jgi:hypothetical protein
MNVLLLSGDLTVASRLSHEAREWGGGLAWNPSATGLAAREEASTAALVVLDLATNGLDIPAAVAAFRALPTKPGVVAFGPHVHEARLDAARKAGCDLVCSRGQFHSQASVILRRWLDSENQPPAAS